MNDVCSMWSTRRMDFGVRRFVDQGKDELLHWLHFKGSLHLMCVYILPVIVVNWRKLFKSICLHTVVLICICEYITDSYEHYCLNYLQLGLFV